MANSSTKVRTVPITLKGGSVERIELYRVVYDTTGAAFEIAAAENNKIIYVVGIQLAVATATDFSLYSYDGSTDTRVLFLGGLNDLQVPLDNHILALTQDSEALRVEGSAAIPEFYIYVAYAGSMHLG